MLLCLFPVVAFPQQNWIKSSQLDSAWKYVGNAGFSAGEAENVSIAFSPLDGQPYVAFQDLSNSKKATVMKFDGTNWVDVGNAGFSAREADDISFAFSSSDGQPYVAYVDFGHSQKATVMKFNGTNWVLIGNKDFSPNNNGISMAFSPTGEPFIAILGGEVYGFATIMKFTGSNWVFIGIEGFSAGQVYYNSLKFSPSGEPYLAFNDEYYSYKARMMKFNGDKWIDVGKAGFSAAVSMWESLAFSSNGIPYVAYKDCGNGCGVTVMKYDSVMNGINELQELKLPVYPDPAGDLITFETSTQHTQSQLSISSINGKQLITRQLTQPKMQVDISSLPSGVYFVQLINDKSVAPVKFIKK